MNVDWDRGDILLLAHQGAETEAPLLDPEPHLGLDAEQVLVPDLGQRVVHPVGQPQHVLHVVARGPGADQDLLRDLGGRGGPEPERGLGGGHEHEDREGRVLRVRCVEERDLLGVASKGHLAIVEIVQGLVPGELHGHAVGVGPGLLDEGGHSPRLTRGAAMCLIALPEPPGKPVDFPNENLAVLEPRVPDRVTRV